MQRDESNRPLRMLGTITDLSFRKKIEEELVAARVMADSANQAKSEFLANMSHEIRTPLTSILGYADLLSCPDATAGEVADSVATIKNAGHHLLTIINDVLDLSKIEAGKMTVERIPFSPSQLMHDVLCVLQPAAQAKGIVLKAQSAGKIPKQIISDPVRVRQILMNLAGNAVKFTEKGQVSLKVEFVPSSDGQNSSLAFEITDTGIGMTKTQCDGLFEPFMQADASTSRQFGGTGLGLAICRRMAKMLHGEILAQSEPGIGSTFRVTVSTGVGDDIEMQDSLSLDGQHLPKSEPSEKKLQLDGRILLAEDNPVNRRLFEQILRNAGAIVDVAENGRIAVEKATDSMTRYSSSTTTSHGYDLILMDMQMPVLDGYSATRQLRSQDYRGPIVALTAHALDEDRRKCILIGCNDVATKPIEKQRLITICQKWISYDTNVCVDKDALARTGQSEGKCQVNVAALMDGLEGDFELLQELTDVFRVSTSELLSTMQQSIQSGDSLAIEQCAHSLKGAVGNFTDENAFKTTLAIETFAREQNLAGAIDAYERLETDLENLISELSAVCERGAVGAVV